MFENEQSYKYMVIENKQITQRATSPRGNRAARQRQAQDMLRKVNLGDVSFISTDLHQNNQFDFNNKIHPQKEYRIRLYGPIRRAAPLAQNADQVIPSQLGLDVLRMSKAKYTLKIHTIEFPKAFSK